MDPRNRDDDDPFDFSAGREKAGRAEFREPGQRPRRAWRRADGCHQQQADRDGAVPRLVVGYLAQRGAEGGGLYTPSEAREAFGATLAITGTLRRLGNRLEILVNLVDTETAAQLRSFTIETEFPDPASLQDKIVSKASEMLDISLSPGAFVALQAGNAQVPSAYRYYIEGRGYLQRFDKAEYLEKAIVAFGKATSSTPVMRSPTLDLRKPT